SEAAAKALAVKSLRDLSVAAFEERATELPDLLRRRARHVIGENERVRQAVEALRVGDLAQLGELINLSQQSLRVDYEVSSDALNTIVKCARSHPAALGARLTGGGFAGCAIAALDVSDGPELIEDFTQTVSDCYTALTDLSPVFYTVKASAGAGLISLPES
ncbi:MAG: galactokinase, partial [Chloroflexi bacterium]|nr:galactokinase [Chloroflexota bacterium]